jgi:GTPase SAR1 family protein
VSAAFDTTIRLWDVASGRQLSILEGHTGAVIGLRLSLTTPLLVSRSADETVRIWNINTGQTIEIVHEAINRWRNAIRGLDLHPAKPLLATLGDDDTVIRIWQLDYDVLLAGDAISGSVRYTTAKVVLVGDSGVGKTGLGWRLAHGEFKDQSSTHGQQFWIIGELGTTRTDGAECEAVLWDLAGQPDYRLVHSLFPDDVDLALVLFDPTDRQNPLAGVDFWLNQLRRQGQTLCRCILIGARTDRGSATLTEAELAAYCRRCDLSGGYIATSARTGEGLPRLLEEVKHQIRWDDMPATVTTSTFKRIKEHVLSLKEDETRGGVLVSPSALRERLQRLDDDWDFSDDEMMTATRHLETHGYVTILRGSQGNVTILLTRISWPTWPRPSCWKRDATRADWDA